MLVDFIVGDQGFGEIVPGLDVVHVRTGAPVVDIDGPVCDAILPDCGSYLGW